MAFNSSFFRVINQFKDDYAFLSNFHPWNVVYRGLKYATAEHAFQAAKGKEISDKLWIAESSTAGVAKRRGRKVELREDWDSVKISVMLEIVQSKFFLPWRKEKLVATKDLQLIEGNYWHDNIWGDCLCTECDKPGKNYLGKILMAVRDYK